MIRKRDYVYRYLTFWVGRLSLIAMPLVIISFRFGVFKQNPSIWSNIQGMFLIGTTISISLSYKELVDWFNELTKKEWARVSKLPFALLIVWLILLISKNFTSQMMDVIGAFLIGSTINVPMSLLHSKFKKKIHKAKEKKDTE